MRPQNAVSGRKSPLWLLLTSNSFKPLRSSSAVALVASSYCVSTICAST